MSAPSVDIPSDMRSFHDESYLPDKSIYPARPGEPGFGTNEPFDSAEKPSYGGYANNNYSYDNDDDYFGGCCNVSSCLDSKAFKVIGMIGMVGIWVAFMFMNIAIFTGIGKTSNWLNCLAYCFLGLPLCALIYGLVQMVIASATDIEDHADYWMIMPLVALVFWFAIGIPLCMVTAQEHALVRYLNPQFQQDRDCYREVQPNYKHGSVHFIFLKDREWALDNNSFVSAKMKYDGNHYFYAAALRYTGKASFNCQRPIIVTCYSAGSVKSFETIKKSCWNQPPTGVSIRVMNQNEQFYRNWIQENDSEAEEFVRKTLVKKMSIADQHPEPAVVTYNGDNPLDFVEKLSSVRKARRAVLICAWVIWSVLCLCFVFDPRMRAIILPLYCILIILSS